MRSRVRENALAGAVALLALYIVGWLGLYGWAWTDYDDEVRPALDALVGGHVLTSCSWRRHMAVRLSCGRRSSRYRVCGEVVSFPSTARRLSRACSRAACSACGSLRGCVGSGARRPRERWRWRWSWRTPSRSVRWCWAIPRSCSEPCSALRPCSLRCTNTRSGRASYWAWRLQQGVGDPRRRSRAAGASRTARARHACCRSGRVRGPRAARARRLQRVHRPGEPRKI